MMSFGLVWLVFCSLWKGRYAISSQGDEQQYDMGWIDYFVGLALK